MVSHLSRRTLQALCGSVLVLSQAVAHAQLTFAEPPLDHDFGKIPLETTYAAQYFGLFNSSATPVSVGLLRVDSQIATCAALGCPVVAPSDFVLRDPDACSNSTLAPGQGCSSLIIFSPKQPGQRTARIVFPIIGSVDMSRPLSGTGVSDPTDCVLDWAERTYPSLFTQPTPTVVAGGYFARCYAGNSLCVGSDAGYLATTPHSLFIYMGGQLSRYEALATLAQTATHAPTSSLRCSQPRPQP